MARQWPAAGTRLPEPFPTRMGHPTGGRLRPRPFRNTSAMRSLHELPRFGDRWSYLYLEMGTLDQTAAGLAFHNKTGDRNVPIDQLCVVMLGPGTTITHAAVKSLAQNNCLLAWVGQDGVRLYAHSTGGTFS